MKITGERFLPQLRGEIKYTHWHRYAVAQEFVHGKRVLDIASGEGYGSALLAGAAQSVVGVDIDQEAVDHASREYGGRPNLQFRQGSCEAIPLDDNSVDVVTSFETIEHHDKHQEMMREIKRVLTPDGVLIISSPNKLVYSDEPGYSNPFHVKELYYEELLELLGQSFRSVRIYGQQLLAGSFIAPFAGSSATLPVQDNFTSYSGSDHDVVRAVSDLNAPLMFIAVCSDVETNTQVAVNSVYLDRNESLLDAMMQAGGPVGDVHQIQQQLEEIRSSRAFRFLTGVVWPVSSFIGPTAMRRRLGKLRRLVGDRGARRAMEQTVLANVPEQFVWRLKTDLTQPLVVGQGNMLHLTGWCYHTHRILRSLSVQVDDETYPIVNHSFGSPEFPFQEVEPVQLAPNSVLSGFWVNVPFTRIEAPRQAKLTLRAVLDNGQAIEESIGTIDLIPTQRTASNEGVSAGPASGEPLVAVCMATYNPSLDFFVEQIETLKNQTYRNWICLISDDASSQVVFEQMQRVIGDDPRFRLDRNSTRLGFYRNFERALTLVPPAAEFVALADQDDRWFPEKLETCLAAFKSDTTLVYSDLNTITGGGEVISSSLWTDAMENNHSDFEALLYSNSVPGAACIFRSQLLDDVLPFPPPTDNAYHDHWIASVSLGRGAIQYIDEPLYSWRQHTGNVCGQRTVKRFQARPRFAEIQGWLNTPLEAALGKNSSLLAARNLYFHYLMSVELNADVLRLRLSDITPEKKAVLDKFGRFKISRSALVRQYIDAKRFRGPAHGLEWCALRGALGFYLFNLYCRQKHIELFQGLLRVKPETQSHVVEQSTLQEEHTVGLDASAPVDFLVQKIAPLKLRISSRQPRRVNILISGIDFEHLFAGYMGMLNLARQLVHRGHETRLICVDACNYDLAAWRRALAGHEELADLLDHVSTAYVYNRSAAVDVNPDDAFVATSWWTAHIAHQAMRSLNRKKFIYLLQEYEPLFHAAGAYYALAEQAYNFPHQVIFSTPMLRDYFRENRLGVFHASVEAGDADSTCIENAVPPSHITATDLMRSERRKLLFYARPNYAPRNMYELGILALRAALEEGAFDVEKWDFHGIGEAKNYNSVPLFHKAKLENFQRVDFQSYRAMLPAYDVGLSLMMTPHPSMVPLDMAAAGIVTVTNTFGTKTAESMAAISPNIIAVSPTVDDLKQGLLRALREIDDVEKRVKGSQLHWSSRWESTYGGEVMAQIEKFLQ